MNNDCWLIYNGTLIPKKYDGSASIRDFARENYNAGYRTDCFESLYDFYRRLNEGEIVITEIK